LGWAIEGKGREGRGGYFARMERRTGGWIDVSEWMEISAPDAILSSEFL
jgi:hypothetical protein